MEFKEVVKNRFSCKKYSSRKLEPSKLEAILEAGRLAPTAKNLQEQHVYVVQSEEILTKIDGVTPCRYGAPVVLVVAFDTCCAGSSFRQKQCVHISGRKARFGRGGRDDRGDPHDPGRGR